MYYRSRALHPRTARDSARARPHVGLLVRPVRVPAHGCAELYGKAAAPSEPRGLPANGGTPMCNVAAGGGAMDGYRLGLRRPFAPPRGGVERFVAPPLVPWPAATAQGEASKVPG